ATADTGDCRGCGMAEIPGLCSIGRERERFGRTRISSHARRPFVSRGCRMRTQRAPRRRDAAGRLSAAALCASLAWSAASDAAESGLADAARDGDLARVLEQIAAGADVDAAHADGTTPLLWAVHRGDLELVETLLAAGASVDLSNEFGVTPLLEASRVGDAALVAALLDAGADASR